MINQSTATRAEHVPYRGVAPDRPDERGKDYGMLVLSSGLPQVRGDRSWRWA